MSTVEILDPIWLDPTATAPVVYIKTQGLILEQHSFKVWGSTWTREGSNNSTEEDPSGTPDTYKLSKFRQMGGKVFDAKVELVNVRQSDENYSVIIEIRQADYEADIIMHKEGSLVAEEGGRTAVFRAFAPLRIMS